MTNHRATRHEARGHPGRSSTGPWRPLAEVSPGGLSTGGPAAPAEDGAALLAGDWLALNDTRAASLLGISRALAYELVARGELPSIRLGRRLLVP
jgi:excisionase family DNA binding protein